MNTFARPWILYIILHVTPSVSRLFFLPILQLSAPEQGSSAFGTEIAIMILWVVKTVQIHN